MEQGRLLIKHAVGGPTFVDSAKAPVDFAIREEDGKWRFEVNLPAGEAAEGILKWRQELNLFYFEDHLQPVKKNWYYVLPESVVYDAEAGKLRIDAASRIEYVPDEYKW